jgi:hypothetical protein
MKEHTNGTQVLLAMKIHLNMNKSEPLLVNDGLVMAMLAGTVKGGAKLRRG